MSEVRCPGAGEDILGVLRNRGQKGGALRLRRVRAAQVRGRRLPVRLVMTGKNTVIDAHAHAFPDALAPKAIARLSSHYGHSFAIDGTIASLRASMRKAGITHTVILPVGTRPDQTPSINRFAAGLAESPDLIPFGTATPARSNFKDDIARLRDAGIRGVKFHADYQGFNVDEARLFPLYEAIAGAGLIAFFHSGGSLNVTAPPRCTPDRLARVMGRVPELRIVAAHLGGWRMWDSVEQHLIGRPLWLDTSFCMDYMPPDRMMRMARAHGMDRVLFGTDSPWNSQGAELERIRSLPWTADELERLLCRNASALFMPRPTS